MEEVKEVPADQIQKRAVCGEKTEVYSRVVGYFRPVQQWNKGKQAEFKNRKTFGVPVSKKAEPKREGDLHGTDNGATGLGKTEAV